MNQDLICILGPTASGKTRYAVNMALERGGEIISAD
ncbi:MAG: isopentenyl transferase family protein, partial [Bacteroidales bacterium]|nr:isopentenyl transferase family protein [Bacteroidales bacterium]